jgi:hypothetical protein
MKTPIRFDSWLQSVPGAAAYSAYVVWPNDATDLDLPHQAVTLTGALGCVWQSSPGGPWFGIADRGHRMVGVGAFGSLPAAHKAVSCAASPARRRSAVAA